jgi:4-hydroxy-tetrahydrodipicolinate synthase
MTTLVRQGMNGDFAAARETHLKLLAWMRAAFVESNPIPVKAALALMGRMENALRAPLVPLAEGKSDVVRSALAEAGAL